MEEFVPRYTYRSTLPNLPAVDYQLQRAMFTCELNVGFVTSFLKMIGPVTHNGQVFMPVMFWDHRSPVYTNLLNLRRAVTSLALPGQEHAEYYLGNHSIPSIRLDRGGILTNADEIIPPNYGSAALLHDASAVRTLMNFVAAKMRDTQNHTGRLGLVEAGSPAILLASTITGVIARTFTYSESVSFRLKFE